ncbi:MAG TPA: hypothetical protein VFX48_09500, partial [Saprospiraceae bacterium]|nr:hypothetical protein [Saprospiraceae bacterium]
MIRYSIFAGFLGSLLILSSCSEDFQLTEPYKDIPVVYGIIKRTDTAQYIRVQKAFVDENLAASQIAKNPDSLYYTNPEVKLINATTKKEYTLFRVDGNLEGYPREAGPFATAPNYLYKILTKDLSISGGDQLVLSIDRKNGTPLVTANIVAVGDLLFS